MRMVPPQPPLAATGSEIELFRLLERVDFGEHAVAFTSLNLSNHEYKKWGEIDFVVLAPEGLIAIEVKGGQVHCDQRGLWRYESRGRQPIERAESPMAQVSSAYFSLRDRHLAPLLGRPLLNAAPSGFGVVLAKTSARDAHLRGLIGGTEMPADLVATRDDVETVPALEATLRRFLAHWNGKRSSRKWTPAQVATIASAMRPWFDRVVPLSLSAARVREEQLSLTTEQYAVLDFSDSEMRVICTGGAGCGKTLLAVECLRRESQSNALLVTGTDSLASHLRSSHSADPARILSFNEVAQQAEKLSRTYDCLIVDEGQQITNPSALDVLSGVLAKGLEHGRWRWFSDPNNQVARTSDFDAASQTRLEGMAFKGSLNHNCRNTPQIVQTVRVVTGAAVGRDSARGQGPEVIFASDLDKNAQVLAAAKTIRNWLSDSEIAPGEIVLLSPLPMHESSIPAIARVAGFPYRPWQPGWSGSPAFRSHLAASTVEEFRGIEAPFVVLCDIDTGLDNPVRNLYLGMTRPNFGLFVMADHEVIARAVTQSAAGQPVNQEA